MTTRKPFETAIELVQDIEKVVHTLNSPDLKHPLEDLIAGLDDVILAMSLVDDIDDAWDLISTAWTAVDAAADTLTAFVEWVPGLDVMLDVIDLIDGALNTADDAADGVLTAVREVADETVPIMRDIFKGLKEVHSLLGTIDATLPSLVNTMMILQAMTQIVEAIAPLFETEVGKTSVGKRLEKLLEGYEAVDKDIQTAAKPLKTAFDDVSDVLQDMGDVVADINKVTHGTFSKIESDFRWVSNEVGKIEGDVSGIAKHLAPVRWVLDKVSSVIKKLIKPVLHKVAHLLHLDELEHAVVQEIESRLGFEAIAEFQNLNGSASDKKTSIFANNQSKTGSHKAQAMKDFFKDLEGAFKDYKRGDKNAAVEELALALIDALTGGKIDLTAGPPLIPKKHIDFDIPAVQPLPTVIDIEDVELPGYQLQTVLVEDDLPAKGLAKLAQRLVGAANGDGTDFQNLCDAISAEVDSLIAANKAAAPALAALNTVAGVCDAPESSAVELGALTTIAQSVSDTVANIVSLYPDKTGGLVPYVATTRQLSQRLGALSDKAQTLQPVMQSVPQSIADAVVKVGPAQRLGAHSTALAGIATSAGSVASLLAMLDQLDADLGGRYASRVQQVHQLIAQNTQLEITTVAALQAPTTQLTEALTSVRQISANTLAFYQGMATWGLPVKKTWLPALLNAAKYASAIDSILAPLSYLLQMGGCAKAKTTAGAEADLSINIKVDAWAAVQFVEGAALTALEDVIAALPKVLEFVSEAALHLDQLESVLDTGTQNLKRDMDALGNAAATAARALADVAAGTVPAQSYVWKIKRNGKEEIIQISNVFFAQKDAENILALVQEMLSKSVGLGHVLPDASDLIQSWRTPS